MKVIILGMEGCLPSGFFGLLDILTLAKQAVFTRDDERSFEILSASIDGNPVRDGYGNAIAVDASLRDVQKCDAIFIPGFAPKSSRQAPDLKPLREAAALIRRQHSQGALICGSCSGVFLLGEAGLLDGRSCTTTWWLHDEMKNRHPKAKAKWGATLIDDKGVVTAGGPVSWIDLALHVVRRLFGPEAARIAADFTVVDTAPSTQAAYIPAGHLAGANPLLMEAEHIIRHAAQSSLTAQTLAQRLSTSGRTLHRRLVDATGQSPKQFIDRIRFEMARDSLEMTAKSVKQIAAAIGYLDENSFRRTFKRLYGMNPTTYRILVRSRSHLDSSVPGMSRTEV